MAASEQRRLQQLFHDGELGDRKPTQLLHRMQQQLGDRASATDGTLLPELFLQRLPSNVRMVLASTSNTTNLEELAELADKVLEVAALTVAATTALLPQLLSEVEQLRAEVSKLQTSIRTLTRQSRTCQPSPAHPPPAESFLCWYNHTYGEAARKCRSPCSYSTQSNDQAGH